jgi:hypothetical protein
MKARNIVWIGLLGLGLFAGGVAVGQDPALWHRHPRLAEAGDLAQRAIDKLGAAQAANDWDMQGHAERARDLLKHAGEEIHAAAVAADHP